jgi:hypothetical protein
MAKDILLDFCYLPSSFLSLFGILDQFSPRPSFTRYWNLICRYLVGLLEQETGSSQGLLSTQESTKKEGTQMYIHAPSGIQTHSPHIRAVKDSTHIRLHDHCDQSTHVPVTCGTIYGKGSSSI